MTGLLAAPPAARRAPPARRRSGYLEFISNLDIKLEAKQAEVCSVLFDGKAPAPVDGAWRSPVSRSPGRLFGFEGRPPADALGVALIVAGIRSGKTRFCGALRLLHLALTTPIGDDIADGERVVCSFTAPLARQARAGWRYARGLALKNPGIRKHVVKATAERFVIASPFDPTKEISFECFAASAGGDTLRSCWHLGGYVDEAAFYGGEDNAVNGKEIYDALTGRIYKGGQLIIGTSPWAEEGFVYELFKANFERPESAIVAQAPTDVLRSNPYVLDLMARKRREYERRGELDLWEREFCAKFLSLGGTRMYDEDTLKQCGRVPRGDLKPGDVVAAGADLGLVSDHAALVPARRRGDRYAPLNVVEKSPTPGEPLKPSVVCGEFVAELVRCGASRVMADGYYREALREALRPAKGSTAEAALIFALKATGGPAGAALAAQLERADVPGAERTVPGLRLNEAPSDPSIAHTRTRELMKEGKVDLIDDERLLHQLTLVKRKPGRPGRLVIEMPRGSHGHCDVAAAFALAIYQTHGVEVKAPPPAPGTPEWHALEAKKMKEEALRRGRPKSAW